MVVVSQANVTCKAAGTGTWRYPQDFSRVMGWQRRGSPYQRVESTLEQKGF